VTIAKRPFEEQNVRVVKVICPTPEAKYFLRRDWTGSISLSRFNKFAVTRRVPNLRTPPDSGPPASVDQNVAKHDGFMVQFVARGTDERQIIILSRSFLGFITLGKLGAERVAS
jgi:hypothetical protein